MGDFDHWLSQRKSFEHISYPGIFVDQPEFLVILSKGDQEVSVIYGGYIANLAELSNAILFRATELMDCSMVDPILNRCEARLVSPHGDVWFGYIPQDYNYQIE